MWSQRGPVTTTTKGYSWWVPELHGDDFFFHDCGAPDTGEAIAPLGIGLKNEEAKANESI